MRPAPRSFWVRSQLDGGLGRPGLHALSLISGPTDGKAARQTGPIVPSSRLHGLRAIGNPEIGNFAGESPASRLTSKRPWSVGLAFLSRLDGDDRRRLHSRRNHHFANCGLGTGLGAKTRRAPVPSRNS